MALPEPAASRLLVEGGAGELSHSCQDPAAALLAALALALLLLAAVCVALSWGHKQRRAALVMPRWLAARPTLYTCCITSANSMPGMLVWGRWATPYTLMRAGEAAGLAAGDPGRLLLLKAAWRPDACRVRWWQRSTASGSARGSWARALHRQEQGRIGLGLVDSAARGGRPLLLEAHAATSASAAMLVPHIIMSLGLLWSPSTGAGLVLAASTQPVPLRVSCSSM
jgi:hypothetical protein